MEHVSWFRGLVIAAFANLHLVLQSRHVSLLHQLVERNKLPEALGHSHDPGLFGEVLGELQSHVEPHLVYPATTTTQITPATTLCTLVPSDYVLL